MKRDYEKKFTFLLLIAGILIFSNSLVNLDRSVLYSKNNTNEIELKDSGFWNLTGTPIFINGTDPDNNWTFAVSQPWCSGYGNSTHPYIIEDIVFDGENSGNCFEIINSNAFFIISNCTISNSGDYLSGIKLENVSNGQITENYLFDNDGGIFIDETYNCSIFNNYIVNNTAAGIMIEKSEDCIVNNNTIYSRIENLTWGIVLYFSKNITLFFNNMTNCGLDIIVSLFASINVIDSQFSNSHTINTSNIVNNKTLYYYVNSSGLSNYDFNNPGQIVLVNCSDSSISNVDLFRSSVGLSLIECNNITMQNITSNFNREGIVMHYTNNSKFLGNSLSENYFGAEISDCFNITVANTNISYNGFYGINVDENSTYNTFYGNNFENNAFQNAACDNSSNFWNASTIGNYWDDYTDKDSNDDNIGDTSYTKLNIEDYLPIWWDAPAISMVNPLDYSLFTEKNQNFSIKIDEGLGNYTWHEFLETGNISSFVELNGTIDEEFNGSYIQNQLYYLDNGTTIIRFYANDSRGYIGYKDLVVHVDILPPLIDVIYPISGLIGPSSPNFTINVVDGGLDEKWYQLNNNNTKFFFTGNESINQIAWNLLPDGLINITFYANDSSGNEHLVMVQNYKDTEKPLINDNQEDIVQFYPGELYDVDFRDSDPVFNISYIQYTIYNDTGQSGTRYLKWTNISTNINSNNFTADWAIDFTRCHYGKNYISVRVYDEAGNYEELNDVFIVTKVELPYSNPLRDFLLMIMIGLPILLIGFLSVYYGSKYYIKNKVDTSKIEEIKKRVMVKKKKKPLSLADEYLAKTSSAQDEQIQKTSTISIDAESQSIAALNAPEDHVQAAPTIEIATISIICPICKKNKKVIIPKSIIDEAKQLTAVSIAKDIVCEHHFQVFVDKNYIVRGYQKVDFHL